MSLVSIKSEYFVKLQVITVAGKNFIFFYVVSVVVSTILIL